MHANRLSNRLSIGDVEPLPRSSVDFSPRGGDAPTRTSRASFSSSRTITDVELEQGGVVYPDQAFSVVGMNPMSRPASLTPSAKISRNSVKSDRKEVVKSDRKEGDNSASRLCSRRPRLANTPRWTRTATRLRGQPSVKQTRKPNRQRPRRHFARLRTSRM